MKTNINKPMTWALALGVLALAGCDSVKDVRSEPSTALPTQKVVLKGVINGLGGGRTMTLGFSSDDANDITVLGADPAFATATPESVPFSFGALDEGTEYDIVVRGQPFGKECMVSSGGTGTLVRGQDTAVVLTCTPDVPRRNLTVQIPADPAVFSGLPGAKVVVYTGEWMQERTVTPGQTSVTFDDALFSATVTIPNPNTSPGQPPTVTVAAGTPLTYTVSASFIDTDGLESRCLITNATGSNPATDVTNVIVGLSTTTTVPACQFTMSGSVAYNPPPGGATEAGAIPGGLLLEVRDTQGNVKTSYEVTAYGAFTVGGATPVLFASNVAAVFDVVVARQPTGRTCVVGDGGGVSLYRTGSINPTNITDTAPVATLPGAVPGTRAWGSRLNVFCRALPAAGRELSGTYRLSSSTWKPAATTSIPNPVAVTATFNNYDWTVQNLGSSNMLAFFADGTFLHGTHGYAAGGIAESPFFSWPASLWSVQVEQGFYDYDPGTGTLRFTLITDTDPTAAFPATYSAANNSVWNAARTGFAGLSAAPAPTVNGTPVAGGGIGMWTAVMNNVQLSRVPFGQGRNPTQTLGRITGVFGGASAAAARLDWVLTEPQSINSEMTGTWASRDNRRIWVWDYLNYYGTHVGVTGGAPSMNDACFTVSDVQAPFGVYTRRGTSTGCFAYNRPARGDPYLFGFNEGADFHLTDVTVSSNTFVGVANLASATGTTVANSRLVPQFGTTALAVLPGFVGRMPGGQSAADGRSPSPVVYLIAPAATFAAAVANTTYADLGQPAAAYFDVNAAGPFTWCPTEILAVRSTLNSVAINYPVYFCRTRAP